MSVTIAANPHSPPLGAPLIKRIVLQHVPEPSSQRLLLEKAATRDLAINSDAVDQVIKPLLTDKARDQGRSRSPVPKPGHTWR